MKANELMIGDWVLHHNDGCIDAMNDTAPYDEAIRIERDDFELDECFWGRLDPIPLTSEILEKNGFEECIWGGKESWRRRYLVHNEVLICIGGRDGGLKYFGYQGYNSKICLTYVHELQHALRLVGIEKEIVL